MTRDNIRTTKTLKLGLNIATVNRAIKAAREIMILITVSILILLYLSIFWIRVSKIANNQENTIVTAITVIKLPLLSKIHISQARTNTYHSSTNIIIFCICIYKIEIYYAASATIRNLGFLTLSALSTFFRTFFNFLPAFKR